MAENDPPARDEHIRLAHLVAASFSFLGSGLIIITYRCVRKFRHWPNVLVFYVGVCYFCESLRYMVPAIWPEFFAHIGYHHLTWCSVEAAYPAFFKNAHAGWTFIISLNFFFILKDPLRDTRRYLRFYHAYVWLTSCMMVGAVYATSAFSYDERDGTCTERGLVILIMSSFFVAVAWICSVFVLLYTLLRLRMGIPLPTSKRKVAYLRQIRITVMYVCTFTLHWGISSVCQMIYAFSSKETRRHEDVLYIVNVSTVSAAGFLTAVVWLSDPSLLPLDVLSQRLNRRVAFWRRRSRNRSSSATARSRRKSTPRRVKSRSESFFAGDELEDIVGDEETAALVAVEAVKRAASPVEHAEGGNVPAAQTVRQGAIERGKGKRKAGLQADALSSFVAEYRQDIVYAMLENIQLRARAMANQCDGSVNTELVLSDFSEVSTSRRPSRGLHLCTFRDFAPKVFERIRHSAGLSSEDFLSSLDPAFFAEAVKNSHFSEGRSHSFFIVSANKRYVVKTVTANEARTLQRILHKYYCYLERNRDTLIVRFFGLYSISLGHKYHFVLMENVFETGNLIAEKYDLKGSWVNRRSKDRSLLLDADFVSSIRLDADRRVRLQAQIKADTEFFERVGIMDYSLLVGIHHCSSRGAADPRRMMSPWQAKQGLLGTGLRGGPDRMPRSQSVAVPMPGMRPSPSLDFVGSVPASLASSAERAMSARRTTVSGPLESPRQSRVRGSLLDFQPQPRDATSASLVKSLMLGSPDHTRSRRSSVESEERPFAARPSAAPGPAVPFKKAATRVEVTLENDVPDSESEIAVEVPEGSRAPGVDRVYVSPELLTRLLDVNSSKIRSIPFHKMDENGMAATDASGRFLNLIYYIGIVDVLTPYNVDKKLERAAKVWVLRKDPSGVSCLPPEAYAKRFRRFVDQIVQ